MNDQAQIGIVEKKKARGDVLMMLESCYPSGIGFGAMERTLELSGKCDRAKLPGILKYLEDKGYIHVIIPEEPSLKPLLLSTIELAAHGVDLLEESIPDDPGVII